jgi:hypothetical protein
VGSYRIILRYKIERKAGGYNRGELALEVYYEPVVRQNT